MEFLDNLKLGYQVVFTFSNLFFSFLGVLLGTIVGVLPGLGPAATISIILALTYKMDMIGAIIMLSGVYYGAMYGGSTTSILIRVPGEAASVVTCLDGYEMARKGRAGAALGISAFGSFIAGTIGVLGLSVLAPSMSTLALMFGSPEYVIMMIMGLLLVSYLSGGSKIKAVMMAAIGLILGCIGMDPMSSGYRFTFGIVSLINGIDLAIIALGMFGISEILIWAEQTEMSESYVETTPKLRALLPNVKDWKESIGPILRGTVLGFFLGCIPGGGAVLASFSSYALERKVAKNPENFGKGDIRGVAGPESANNAGAVGAFVPLLTLGIPSNAVMALLIGAFMIHGVQPGPLIIKNNPEIFWGLVVRMYIGNVFLVILNLPLIGLFVKLLKVPHRIMAQLIIVICFLGSFTNNNDPFDLLIVAILGIVGYVLRKLDFDLAPLVLAFVIGPILERTLRQSLMLSNGDLSIFVLRPVSLFMVILLILFIIQPWTIVRHLLNMRRSHVEV